MTDTYDYIVVGAGSGGCVVTQRLVAAGKSVLLLEAGPADNTPFIHTPATFIRVIGTKRTWMYRTEAEDSILGRQMYVPQGRTLGGSSSVNAMIYIRGQREDYDNWAALGCDGWSYDDVLPVFKRAENNQRLAGPYHGNDGLLHVSDLPYHHPLSYAFIRAAQQAGVPYSDDFNGERQDGAGFFQTTTHNGKRGSTAATYLKAVRGSKLLTIRTEATLDSLLFENGAVSGVSYRDKAGHRYQALIREECILAAGGIGTPKALQLSGIGHEGELAAHGIRAVRHLPGVGENFQDHITASVYGQTRNPISLLGADKGVKAARHGLQYLMWRTGLLTSNVIESGAFVDTTGKGGRPDVQLHVTPRLVGDFDREPPAGHGLTINPCILRPTSRGTVKLRSADPNDQAMIVANNLTTREDVETMVRGLKLSRRILRAPALASIVEREILPSEDEHISDADLELHARTVAKTVYHPSCTAKMGKDAMAVVDPQLRVHGVPRLRIADISVMPELISGNTNAPTIMIGERCADFLLDRRAG
ncbi:GMC family oxidoreductase [Novosphingobium sp. AP12]|uniref:GMC family oxidoreductase n=1 Tax=Novosphingobium sp. AP12 TaxID=1144305 RepID=UPI0002720FE0|nr:GMC family oxidoreductase N-terminal domain-containing protein [Novosphingobium sp. AP12]EJL30476.1 choline dehydrogenase-like flavoprotein [Novosphingobium sp. AP12]